MKKYKYDPIEMASMEKSVIPFGVYQFIDKRVIPIVLSDGFCQLFDLRHDEAYDLMENDMYRDTHPDDTARISNAAFLFATEDTEYNVVYRTKVQGKYRIVHALGKHVYPQPDVRLAYVWYTDEGACESDQNELDNIITRAYMRVLKEESTIHKEYYDVLTGLSNKTGFFEMAEARRSSLWKMGSQPAIVIFNLNGMKYYNRKFGYKKGDELLQKVAKILASHFGSENCGRFNIDIFAAITNSNQVEDTVRTVFKECSHIENGEGVTIRAGIALDPDPNFDLTLLTDRSRYACDVNRGSRISKFSYFNENTLQLVDKYQYVIDNFEKAIEEEWIQVYFQPIVRAANGLVCDEEALARWNDPIKGFMVPSDFIPTLENANLIYKLDLHMVEKTIEKIRRQEKQGLNIVPISINLSRTDFDACDIVEEIRMRIDNAGIPRDKLTIEITESVVGSDFDFITAQIKRFQDLGFKVWMDDFGSGYSSLDVLQSTHFDLIKFDMRFMQRFNQGDESKIILTELMKMAIGLGIDTLAEGVEYQEQVDFLREVGCTKLQGFYYSKPIPMEQIFKRYENGTGIGFENPDETEYFSAIGRINLYDMALIAREDQESFRNYFDTLPMTILESNGEHFCMTRCNQSFREFAELMSWNIPVGKYFDYKSVINRPGLVFMKLVRQCGEDGNRVIIDDVMPNGTSVHAFIKRIAVNPISGAAAIAIAILGVMDASNQNAPVTYAHIAQALSSDYFNLFYVNLETENFIQYDTDGATGNIAVERHGENFFAEAYKDAKQIIYGPDQERFLRIFTKENVVRSMDEYGAFTLTYRQIYKNEPVYVHMKAVRPTGNDKYVIIGVSNIDAQMKQQEAMERLQQEQITYSRITALTGDILCIYTVDPVTDHYTEYSATLDYSNLGIAKEGENFFQQSFENAKNKIYEGDIERFYNLFTKEKVMEAIQKDKIYGLRYRLMIDGEPQYVSLKAAMVNEKDGSHLIIGIHNIDARLKRDHEYEKSIANADAKINIDSLTGVKNKHAFDLAAKRLDGQINEKQFVEFAVTVFGSKEFSDINTASTGEEEINRIRKTAEIICDTFKHSPVFRFEKDQFAAISQGKDYTNLEELIKRMTEMNEKNAAKGGIVIPFGTARYDGDPDVSSVYHRAAENLKQNYSPLKSG